MKKQQFYALISLFILFFAACNFSDSKSENKKNTSESYEFKATVNNFPMNEAAYLLHIYGEDLLIIDTLKAKKDSNFVFNFDKNEAIGMYRFLINSEKYIDFIFNKENVTLQADFLNLSESLKIETSLESKLYYEYRNQAMESEYIKAQASNLLLQINDEKDAKYQVALATFEEAQKAYQKVVQKILSEHSNTYLSKIVGFSQIPNTDPLWTAVKRNEFLQKTMLENFNFSDTSLLHSSTVAKSIVNYLSLYVSENMSIVEQEKAFMTASDKLLSKAKQENRDVYAFVLEYLLSSFNKLEADLVLEYIAQKFDLNEGCNNAEKTGFIQDKLANIKLFGIGKQAANIPIFDEQGNAFELKQKVKTVTLLIFWASWCEHCTEILPQIKALYEQQGKTKKWEVVAVSLDEDKAVWQAFIKDGNYTWLNSCDFKSWESKVAKSFHLYATPTMYWLDKELVIQEKPKNIQDIKKYIAGF